MTKPCRSCGYQPRVETFSGRHIDGVARLWICSNAKIFEGYCDDEKAYMTEAAWEGKDQ